jgi:hypothetical protein
MWFACELAGQVAADGIKKKLTSLRSFHVDMGYDVTVFHHPQVERVLRAIKRLTPHISRAPPREPLTKELLHTLLRQVNGDTAEGKQILAAFTLAFAGFLRSGEFTYSAQDLNDTEYPFAEWHITRASISFDPTVEMMHLHLPSSKTDPFRRGVSIAIAADAENPFCPVNSMIAYFQATPFRDPRAPLFVRQGGLAFTREYVIKELQQLALAAGLPGNFTGHSFRRGAATWAWQQGISEDDIKVLGRWKSEAVQRYIEKPAGEKARLAKRLTSSALRFPGHR